MDYVKINGPDMSIKLPAKNGILKLSCLKKYFAQASGLTFQKNNEKCGVEIANDDIILVDEVREYDVYCLKDTGGIFNIHNEKRVNDIMKVINEDDDLEGPVVANTPKKKAKNDTRSISLGWKHRENESKKYEQMKGVIGGVKDVILDRGIEYYYEDLLQLCVAAMKNDENKKFLENSHLELGNFKDEIFKEFKQKNVNFWKVAHIVKGRNSVIRIYILSTKKPEVEKSKPLKEVNFPQNRNQFDSWNKSSQMDSKFWKNPSKENDNKEKSNFSFQKSALSMTYNHTAKSGMTVKDPLDDVDYLKSLKLSISIIDVEDINLYHTKLGEGSFGTVLKGEWLGSDVAVKRISLNDGKKKYVYREIILMDKVRHSNIITLMAVAINYFDCYIVMELFNGENLRRALFDKKVYDEYHVKEKKDDIAIQICTVIAFLNSFSPCVTHKDIKPENILINKDCFVKLCDFGVSSLSQMPALLCTTYGNNFKGTPLYMAPEVLIQNQHVTPKADVWSMACVLVELYNESTIWPCPCNDPYPVALQKLKLIILKNQKPDLKNVPVYLKTLLNACFDHQPEKRPSARSLLQCLKNDLKDSV